MATLDIELGPAGGRTLEGSSVPVMRTYGLERHAAPVTASWTEVTELTCPADGGAHYFWCLRAGGGDVLVAWAAPGSTISEDQVCVYDGERRWFAASANTRVYVKTA